MRLMQSSFHRPLGHPELQQNTVKMRTAKLGFLDCSILDAILERILKEAAI